jgi:hypothetical protein
MVWSGESERRHGVGRSPARGSVWEGRQWWRYAGYYQMPDPDPEDKLGLDWYGVPPPNGLYHDEK